MSMSEHNEYDGEPLPDYRPMSKFALVALVTAILSLGVFVFEIFWGLAVLAVILSVIALIGIGASEGRLSGRPIALLALALAMVGATFLPARSQMRNRIMLADAKPVADACFDYLADGEAEKAHQLILDYNTRVSMSDEELVQYYIDNHERAVQIKSFREDTPATLLLELGHDRDLIFEKITAVQNVPNEDRMALRYKVVPHDKSMRPTQLRVVMFRTVYPGRKQGEWFIKEITSELLPE